MAARLPSRLLSRQVQLCRRPFSSATLRLEAHNFTMPAMSPTMTEGNISEWKVKEGDSFSTGDVLLEIETDKASMDVEAQDDGIMAKIFHQDGSKGVQVGTRIAVIADEGDDISSLEIPPDESAPAPEPAKEESKEASAPPPEPPSKPAPSKKSASAPPSGKGQNKKYPLYPSVTALIHENHIPESDVSKIPATGPNGRLLKGDVLAYLGSIDADYSAKQSKRIEHMAHLDLSNIKLATAPEKVAPKAAAAVVPALPAQTAVSVPISLAEVLKTQKRIQDTIGVSLPLSTFLARAVDIANEDLPKAKGSQPSSSDLFNAILGLNAVPKTSRGNYVPQIVALPSTASAWQTSPSKPMKKPDIIDILTGKARASTKIVPVSGLAAAAAPGGSTNIFTVTVPVGEEKRAKTFLERVKTVLQVEPGKLVL